MILNSPTISGSLTVTGNIIASGSITLSGSVASASYAANADLLDGLDATVFTLTSSFIAQTASFTAFTASLNSFSASQNLFTASLNAFSASVLTFTGSAATRLGALEAATASLYTATSSFSGRVDALETYTSSINNKTSSFATTGSNTFIGTQTISGSVLQSGSFTSTGTLTAQTLVVQTITSSVVYSSGSNIFGNDIANTQTFTGSVLITGSLSVNGTSSIVGTGTTNYLPKFTGTSTIGNSAIFDNGGNIGINNTNSYNKLDIVQVGSNNAVTGVGLKIVSDAGNPASMAFSQSARGTATIGMQASGAAPCNFVIGTDVTGAFLFKKGLGGTGGTDLSTGTTQMTLDSSGNLGLGVTPNTWTLGKSISVGDVGSAVFGFGGYNSLTSGAYFDSGWKYSSSSSSNKPALFVGADGAFSWSNAAAGTAGNAITFTQAMTLNDSGRLALGGTTITDNSLLNIQGSTVNHTIGIILNKTNGTAQVYGILNQGPLDIYNYTSSSYMMRINASGNLSIGNTNDTYKLDVNGTGRFSGALSALTSIAVTNSGAQAALVEINSTYADGYRATLRLNNTHTGGKQWDVYSTNNSDGGYGGGKLAFVNVTDSVNALILASTGAATFSSSVTANILNSTSTGSTQIFLKSTGGGSNRDWQFQTNESAAGDLSIMQSTTAGGATYATKVNISPTGNVGIGTSSPTYKLDIQNGADFDIRLKDTSLGGTVGILFETANDFSGTSQAYIKGIGAGNSGVSQLIFGTAGASGDTTATERMRITSSGNVGIGTSSPLNKLDIVQVGSNNAVADVGLKIVSDAGNPASIALSQTGRGTVTIGMAAAGAAPADFVLGTDVAGNIIFKQGLTGTYGTDLTTGTERMRITSGGLFKFQNSGSSYESGTTGVNEFNTAANDTNAVFRNTAASLTGARAGIDVFYSAVAPNSTTACFYQAADNAGGRTLRFEVRSNGGISNFSANDTNLSDERVKKDIIPLESYWDKFKAIEIVKFKYKDQTHDDFNIGVIAQQVQTVAPEFVDVDGFGETPEDGIPYKTIYTADLYHATIKVLQEAITKIETLQAQNDALQSRIETLESK